MNLRLLPAEPTKEMLHAMDEGHMPFGEMLAAYDGMLSAAPPLTAADVDEACRAMWPDEKYWRQGWDEVGTAKVIRDKDRARMRAFLSKLGVKIEE